MKGYALRQLSANGVQLVLNQLFSVAVFYLLSVRLSKTDFGRLNMAFAILLAVFGALSMGLDSLVVKKTAAGADRGKLLRTYLFHVFSTGLPAFALLWLAAPWLPGRLFPLLPVIGLGKLFIFFSTPFKQISSGAEKFSVLARMSLVSNAIRCGGLFLLMLMNRLDLPLAIAVFVIGDLAELIVCVFLFRTVEPRARGNEKTATVRPARIRSASQLKSWQLLLKEAAPQAGVVVISALLSRFDWICIGFLSTATHLAEYSFAYKAFELAQLPLLILAPLLLPRFTRFFRSGVPGDGKLDLLLHAELFVAAGSAMLIPSVWAPVVDGVTSGRYGAINRQTIALLCASLPLIYINNFLWTAWFAMDKLRQILHAFVLTAGVNVVGCLSLIPFFGNQGAAAAYLISMAAQCAFYLLKSPGSLRRGWRPLLLYGACAGIAGWSGSWFTGAYASFLFPAALYLSLSICFSPLTGILIKNLRATASQYATRSAANP